MKNNEQIETKLVEMADLYRGEMDMENYKNILMALMTYRYLSEKELDELSIENELNVTDKKEILSYFNKISGDKSVEKKILDKNGYYISFDNLFDNFSKKIDSAKFDVNELFNAFTDLENSSVGLPSEELFVGVFDSAKKIKESFDLSEDKLTKVISSIIKEIISLNLKVDGGDFGESFEYLINCFSNNLNKKMGDFYTPKPVSNIMSKIVHANNENIGSVYDPVMGSASLLINTAKQSKNKDQLKYVGQEINADNYNLARMNLINHNVDYKNINLRNGNTLDKDWPEDDYSKFDSVVMNPPYSMSWDNSESRLSDGRFKDYGVLPPKSKADLSFVLHGLYHLNDKGTMAVILPHGVLFRGAKEGKIREQLIKNNKIDAIIGLPSNIFTSTSIPTTIIIFKNNKKNSDVLFIDASEEFVKSRKLNIITKDNVDKIVETYADRENVEKFAYVASLEEIEKNDFNLNIPRYVDTYVPESRNSTQSLLDESKKIQEQINDNNHKIYNIISNINDEKLKSIKNLINKELNSKQDNN